MRVVMKKLGLMLALIVTCFALPACDNDDKDSDVTPVSDISTRIIKTWEMVSVSFVTVEDNGSLTREEGRKPQSLLWEFRKDGYQYATMNGEIEKGRYAFSIKGNQITLTQDVAEDPEIRKGVATITNGTMVMKLYDDDTKKSYAEYVFQQIN